MLGEVESEIFQKYKNALVAIGVDFDDYSVIDFIEDCNYNLEPKFQAIISCGDLHFRPMLLIILSQLSVQKS